MCVFTQAHISPALLGKQMEARWVVLNPAAGGEGASGFKVMSAAGERVTHTLCTLHILGPLPIKEGHFNGTV